MTPALTASGRALAVALLGGCLYVAGILLWSFATGIQFATGSPTAAVLGLGYAAVGMFLIASVPLYLLGRASLVAPVVVAAWSFGNTVYLRWFVPRPHDALASYLTVWPLFVGIIVAAALVEAAVRIGADRSLGRFGLRSLV